MFWIGIVGMLITLIIGLLPIPLFKDFIQTFVPELNDNLIDWLRIGLLFSGFTISLIILISNYFKIKSLNDQVTYQDIALYNMNGDKSARVNGVPMVRTPIHDCKTLEEMIEKLPQFPFPYYRIAIKLKEKGDQSWREYANRAKLILKKTTKIPGHHSDHDKILKEVQILTNQNRT